MPLYEYKCKDCGREFEDLGDSEDRDTKRHCPSCSSFNVERKMSTFGIASSQTIGRDTLHSPKEIDRAVGKASETGWEAYKNRSDKRNKRLKELKGIKEITINKGSDGTVRPLNHMGDTKEQSFRKDYSKEYGKQITRESSDSAQVKMKVNL